VSMIYKAMLRKAAEPWKGAFRSGRKYITVIGELVSSSKMRPGSKLRVPKMMRTRAVRRWVPKSAWNRRGHWRYIKVRTPEAIHQERLAQNIFRRLRGQPALHYADDLVDITNLERVARPISPAYVIRSPTARKRIKIGAKEQQFRNQLAEEVRGGNTIIEPLSERELNWRRSFNQDRRSLGVRFIHSLRKPARFVVPAGFAGAGAFGAKSMRDRALRRRSSSRFDKSSRRNTGFINSSGMYQTYDKKGNIIELFPEEGDGLEKGQIDLSKAMVTTFQKIVERGLANE